MRIVMVASEVAPFSKEGGLADVLGALPRALSKLGEDVSVISPLYRGVRQKAEEVGLPLEPVQGGCFDVPMGDGVVAAVAWRTTLPKSEVPVYFLQNDRYYNRPGYYCNPADMSDYQDNSERFIFLSRGAVELCLAADLRPDVLHCHDWHTGLVPIYVKYVYRDRFPQTATVFTIHNIAYQGIFWHWDMNLAGLPWSLFNWKMLEYYGNMSFLKAGLVGADILTTVSKTYSREIQTPEHGCGMDGVLRERAADLYGIINGIDVEAWDPQTDPALPAHYSANDLSGKAVCKAALQREFGLPCQPRVPLMGIVCRLVDQKGLDIAAEAMPQMLGDGLQMVVLGTGEPRYHDLLRDLAAKYSAALSVRFAFDERLAHLIEAGCDMFLVPSKFEPCGLNQLYSLRYGTVPIVHGVGGLADTVVDYSEDALLAGQATGFVFDEYSAKALLEAVGRALRVYADPAKWQRLMRNGMAQDWSWNASARDYVKIYRRARRKVAKAAGS